MKKISLLVVLGTSLFTSSLADANAAFPWGKGVNQRQKNEHRRIAQGINSGQLTKREARRLRSQSKNIAQKETFFRKTGCGISPGEAAKLDNMQDRYSHSIYKQKHDSGIR